MRPSEKRVQQRTQVGSYLPYSVPERLEREETS